MYRNVAFFVPQLLNRVALCVLPQHPSMAIVKGAGLVMKAIIEVSHLTIVIPCYYTALS